MIYVSHRLDELYAVCDRVTIMRDGRTVARAPMAEIEPRYELVSTMLGRELAETPHRRGRARRGAPTGEPLLEAERPAPRPRAATGVAVDRPRRDRRAGRPARVRPHRDGARHLRRGPARRRHDRRRRRAASRRSPAGDAIAPGSALLGGPQGRGHHPEHVGAREPDARPAAASAPARHRRRGAQREIVDRFIKRARHQVLEPGPADPRAVRRQPAEGAARPLAVHEPEAAAPRRADARHRRRRQARDPGARAAARRRGPGGAADLLGARGDHRRVPTASSCCATAGRSPSSPAIRSPRTRSCRRWPRVRPPMTRCGTSPAGAT